MTGHCPDAFVSNGVVQGRSRAYVGLARRGAVFLHFFFFFVHLIKNLLGSDNLLILVFIKRLILT